MLQMSQRFGDKPTRTKCENCGRNVITVVKWKPTLRTHMAALVLCICLCWPCVIIPYCVKSCKDAKYYCPECGGDIATAERD